MRAARVLLASSLLCAAPGWADPAQPAAVRVASDAKQPALAIDAEGAVYVAAVSAGNVVVSVSKDRGKTFGPPRTAIDAHGRARGGRQRGPRLAAQGKGRLALTAPVTFDDAEAEKPYPTPELYLVTSADGGATWSAPVRVNEVEKKAPEGLHAMAMAPDGTIHVAWLDLRERTARGQDLWYARVVDGKVGTNVRVAQTICECCAPGLALDGAGHPTLVWREGGDGASRELFAIRSDDGGKTFGGRARLNPEDTKENGCPMSAPAVAVSADGTRCAAAWKDVRKGSPRVWWARSTEPWFAVDAPVDEPSVERDHPSLAADEGGTFWVAWEEGRGEKARVVARSSARDEGPRVLAKAVDGVPAFPVLAAGAGLVVAAWETSTAGPGVFARVLADRPK